MYIYLYDSNRNVYSKFDLAEIKNVYPLPTRGIWTGDIYSVDYSVPVDYVTKIKRVANIYILYNHGAIPLNYQERGTITIGVDASFTYNSQTRKWTGSYGVRFSSVGQAPFPSTTQAISIETEGDGTTEEQDRIRSNLEWVRNGGIPALTLDPVFIYNGKLAIANTTYCAHYGSVSNTFLGTRALGPNFDRISDRSFLPFNGGNVWEIDEVDPANGKWGGLSQVKPVNDPYPEYQPIQDFLSESNVTIESGTKQDPFIETEPGQGDGIAPSEDEAVGGESEGSFDLEDDPQEGDSELADISVRQSGFVELFMPTVQEANALASWMHSNFAQLISSSILGDPINSIISLHYVPYTPIHSDEKAEIFLGLQGTGVLSYIITNQFQKVTFGPLSLPEIYGAYTDYNPHSSVSIFLPFIGQVPLDIDDIRKKEMYVVYNCDCFTGGLVAEIIIDGALHYSYSGSCMYQIPVSGNHMPNLISNIISIASGIVGMTASAPVNETGSVGVSSALVSGINAGMANEAISAVKSVQTHMNQHGGTLGHLGGKTPYLILQTPKMLVPGLQRNIIGYPSMATFTISDLYGTGYTEFYKIHLQEFTISSEELEELLTILYNGVLL